MRFAVCGLRPARVGSPHKVRRASAGTPQRDTARQGLMRVHLLGVGLSIMFADAWTVPGAMLPDRAPSSVPHCAPICGVRALGAGGRAHVNADFSQGALKKTRKHGRGGGSRINVIMLMTATRRRNSPTHIHTEIEIAFFRIQYITVVPHDSGTITASGEAITRRGRARWLPRYRCHR